ncbi:Disease resistance protein L6 [Linum perenne]
MFFLRQGAVADEVSADLLSRLSKENSTLETDELVGIDDHVEVVVEKLNLDSTNLTMVGLHGMGGIGKTTIAKAVYNKISSRFDRCCFLENIRETQDQKRGIVIIQEKLTSDILKMDSIRVSNDDEGRKMIKDRICRFKTLIILDDVDEKFKFEDVLGSPKNFHHGSRFIITSRNIKVLGSLNENQCRLYEVGAMSQSRSLELFCKHAFKKNYPPPNYNTLVDGIVSTTGGLPLTLKVIGSMLYREELAVWQEKLEQLRGTIEHQVMGRLPRFPSSLEILRLSCIEGHEIPELDIGDLKKLKVLYLNCSKLQNITGGTFGMLKGLQELDLTYFECKNLREVIVDVGELSSLKILRTKGAREVEYETPIGLKELSTSSRISNLAEMLELEVLKIYDCEFGLDIPPMWWKVSKLKNLRIIQTNINGGGSSSNNNMITTTMLPSSLTSLQIYHCHAWLPSLVNLGNLTLLLMVDCQTICNHLDGIEGLTSLKKLRIQEVKGLARITGLTNLLSLPDCKLEQLAIFNCPDLIELHDDDKAAEVGVVVNSLRSMDIINCPQLDIGPLVRGLTKFPMLEVVWLENIKFTEHQLEGVGSLEELEYCFLKLPSLERITPLSKLKKLKQLTIAGAHGLREIEGLGELKCLEYLILPNCTSLERLWQADDRLENLKKLDIRNCRSLSVEHLSALETGAVADEVSADLLSRLSKENSTLETDELVGIDDHVEVVVEKLNLDSTNLTMVGLHGMGGIGKTTIAKAVYNKISSRFDRCCFLENIRETQDQKRGIVIIQEKLTSDFLRMDSIRVSNDDEGRRMIKDRICRFKTLIILDDVDEKFKFEDVLGSPKNFHQGSRFIITSRNIKVLGSLNENQCRLYEVGAMSQSRSLELFCKHAFKKNYPPPNYNTLVEGIVSTTGGLPLTLKVIGSMLYREELAVWQEKLEQLRGTIEHQVMERLKISYDTLTNEAQQIFLDIACFFIGENKEMPSYMWSDCKFYPASNINILIQRSMIKLGDKDVFQMHDQLRDMGREIVRQENIEHPWMRSRIWSAEEGKKLIYERKGLQELDLSNFKCKNLREVMVDVGELSSLKILRTKGSREVEYETPIGLKELSTSSRISNLAEMLELEVLIIDDCKFGLDIPPMWWKVSKLKYLSVVKTYINGGGGSSNNNMITTMLPSSLTYLHINQCHAWLPSLVNLGNLTDLEMVGCQTLCNHLDGIERMTSLKNLLIYGVKGLARIIGLTDLLFSPNCKLENVIIVKCPDLIELHDDKAAEAVVVVNSLRMMNIVHCPQLDVGPLVRGLTTFPMLWVLCLENIKFTEHQLEGVGSLKELECCILKLPSLERITPLSKLQKLKELTIAGAHGLREIKGLRELKSLEYLILPNCTSLERLWHADDRMENLKKLDIRNCRSLSVEHLSALEAGLPPNVEISWPDEPLSPSTATSGRWNDTIGLSAPDP